MTTMLTRRRIFFFWLPLFFSWLLMTSEAPIMHAVITRLPDPVIALAAFGIVLSLSVTIESPVIMLLSTSTALATDAAAYRVLQRFTWHLNLGLTILGGLIAFVDPIYTGLVEGIIGIPPAIAGPAQIGMKIMLLWTAFIGWRRFNQGILIRFGRTRQVTYGTALRLVFSIGATVLAAFVFGASGVVAAATGLMSGVFCEAIYAEIAVTPVKREHYDPALAKDPLSYWDVVRFHTPLAATSLLSLLAHPLVGAGLARMAYPKESLAVWPIIFALLLIARAAAFALPETVIALSDGDKTRQPIRAFCFLIGAIVSGVFILGVVSPGFRLYLTHVTGLKEALIERAIPGLALSLALPFVTAVQSWLRGLLMKARRTNPIYIGMGINLALMAAIVAAGVLLESPGIETAAIALNLSTIVEALFLWRSVRLLDPQTSILGSPA